MTDHCDSNVCDDLEWKLLGCRLGHPKLQLQDTISLNSALPPKAGPEGCRFNPTTAAEWNRRKIQGAVTEPAMSQLAPDTSEEAVPKICEVVRRSLLAMHRLIFFIFISSYSYPLISSYSYPLQCAYPVHIHTLYRYKGSTTCTSTSNCLLTVAIIKIHYCNLYSILTLLLYVQLQTIRQIIKVTAYLYYY